MQISVEIKNPKELERIRTEGGEVEIYMDYEGLEFLLSHLSFLKNRKTDHVHLMTSEWGGGNLVKKNTMQLLCWCITCVCS